MEEGTKFRIRTFLYYLVVEPFTEKVSLPNFSSIIWILILISVILKIPILLFISIIAGVIFYGIKEYKSGKFIYWYKMKKYKKYKKDKKSQKLEGIDVDIDQKKIEEMLEKNLEENNKKEI